MEKSERRYECETEILDTIIFSFKKQYGFAPAKKNIHLLETSGFATLNNRNKKLHYYDWVAFHVNGIGYEFSVTYFRIERNDAYDMN